MAHALLAVSRPSRRSSPSSVMSLQTDDGSGSSQVTASSNSINNNSSSGRRSLSLRHQYSITSASTTSTLYTCSEEDEDDLDGKGDDTAHGACEEVVLDSRLNGAGLHIPWHNEGVMSTSTSFSSTNSSKKSKEKAANHAMRFKRRGGSSRASLTTLGEDWLPRPSSNGSSTTSPVKATSSQASASSPSKMSNASCTCHLEEESTSDIEDYGADEGNISIDDQLDKMIKMTSDLLRISKGVLTSSKRVSVTKASESQIKYSHEHALRQHLESLETQDRFMHFISNEAHSILTSTGAEAAHSPFTSPHANAPHAYAPSRARLRPHSSNGSISAPAIRATTMYVNAEMGASMSGNGQPGSSASANRERHVSAASHVTGSSGLGSVKEEVEALANGETAGTTGLSSLEGAAAVSTSTPSHAHSTTQASKAVSRKASQLSDISISSSAGLLPSVPAMTSSQRPQATAKPAGAKAGEATTMLLSPTFSQATATSSTPSSSSSFFSSFWSRSTNVSSSSSVSSSNSTPNTTMEASPSLSRLLARKSTPPPITSGSQDPQAGKKDARGMLSALAASSPPLPPPQQPEAEVAHSSPTSNETSGSNSLVPPLSPTISASSTSNSSPSQQSRPFDAHAQPQLPASASHTAALAQLSAIHSSPHLTVSSRPRHRASLSESLLRASWSGTNLKGDAAASSATGPSGNVDKTGENKSHKRSRHSTSPAMQFIVKKSDVSVNHKRERSGRERD